ncbi:MAG: type I-D CRISPR-associated protein Cas10d/Csc3 [Anaerolineae bacterium]
MAEFDLQHIELLIGKTKASVFSEYLDHVGNQALLSYRQHLQWGGKQGESLYSHVLNGVQVLETLRPLLGLSDAETRVLFTAFTVHDLNKVLQTNQGFNRLAVAENVAQEVHRLGIGGFFPAWQEYLEDITSLIRGHSGHHHSGGERMIPRREPVYRLGLAKVDALLHLMRAADVVDLSHTLEERTHKQAFVGYVNAYLADSSQPRQLRLFSHRLTEQRGILTNVIHNAIVEDLVAHYGLTPLLYYPDGVTYLAEKGQIIAVGSEGLARIGASVAGVIAGLTTGKFDEFILSTGQGIKVDGKCLELGVPFRNIWREIDNRVQRRKFDPADVNAKARERAQRSFAKASKAYPAEAAQVQAALTGDAYVVSLDANRLRHAELVRSYYIFLNKHFDKAIPGAWEHIYRLMELPEARWPYYAYFDALWDRAYVLAPDLTLSEEEIYHRIERDGEAITGSGGQGEQQRAQLFTDYLRLYAIFDNSSFASELDSGLVHYVESQHRQCVFCSGPFPTDKWMSADVRSDITVQTFSNRLRGGHSDPKKHICAVCQQQFLLEKLNYPEVRGEKTLYLHLYPYSFLTRPFIQGLNATVRRIVSEDTALQALNMNVAEAMTAYLANRTATPTFRARTEKDKPQPYGIYLPRYAETTGNLLIFPINPAGANDTERFLFALWNALLLQRHFGVKVLLSNMAVAPLGKEEMPDLYVDNIPLGCTGLLRRNDFAQFEGDTNRPGPLQALWQEVGDLFALRRLTFSDGTDRIAVLVRALLGSPLTIFYETEKLLERRVRSQSTGPGGLLTTLAQQAHPHLRSLALSRGGDFMAQLNVELQRLAQIAWQNGLRGRSLEKSSLLFPLDDVLQKMAQMGGAADVETLKAAAVQDIFDHLTRIADEQYKPGRKKWEAVKQFVDGWFDNVLGGVYGANPRKLLNDDKLLRSAFHFYVREQIVAKTPAGQDNLTIPEAVSSDDASGV